MSESLLAAVYIHSVVYTVIQKFGVSKIFLTNSAFIWLKNTRIDKKYSEQQYCEILLQFK